MTFQFTQNYREPVLFWQTIQLFIEDLAKILCVFWRCGGDRVHTDHLALVPPTPIGSCLACDSQCHPVEPASNLLRARERMCFPDENQECRLERIVSVGGVPQRSPTYPEYHRAMPADQQTERMGILARRPPSQ
jgi:hypothetical protein